MAALELPEIETLKRDLERDVSGRKIKRVEVRGLKSLPLHRTKKSFSSLIEGAKVDVVERHGLAIVAFLNNEYSLVIDLGDNAGLTRSASKVPVTSDVAVIITFTQGGDLRVFDPDSTSKISAVRTEELETVVAPPEERGLDLLNQDLLNQPISWTDFGRYVKKMDEPLKAVLTNPDIFVGIGPIYSDEILFDAGLRYDRKANELTTMEIRRLHRSVVGVLHDAIKYRGTSLEGRPFIDLTGEPGEFGEHLAVYQKNGDLSPRNRRPIEKAQFKGKPVYFCSTQV